MNCAHCRYFKDDPNLYQVYCGEFIVIIVLCALAIAHSIGNREHGTCRLLAALVQSASAGAGCS